VNQRIQEIAGRLDTWAETEFMCECGRDGCLELIPVPLAAYHEVRDHPARFIVLSGHEDDEIERVVERRDGFLVVEKLGGPAEAAARFHELP
jgi:hypothetical protein